MIRSLTSVLIATISLILIACSGGTVTETATTKVTTTATTTATSITTTTQQVTTPLASTTLTTTSTTTQATATLTKTAVLLTTTPTENNKAQIQAAVRDIFVPEFTPVQDLIPILITVTNPIDSQWTSDIPITFTDVDDDSNVVIWIINVTLDVGETREILVAGIAMLEARWHWKVGFRGGIIFTS